MLCTAASMRPRQQRLLDLLDEQALAAGLGQRPVLDRVAGGPDGDDLDGVGRGERRHRGGERVAHQAGLGQGQLAAARAEAEEGKPWRCSSVGRPPEARRQRMRVLGIETSCDETAVAVVEAPAAGDRRRSAASSPMWSTASSPSIAASAAWCRRSPRAPISSGSTGWSSEALAEAGLGLGDLDGIAATGGPGLIGGVMVGVMTAKAMAFAHDKPFLAINHLEGHALSVRLTEEVDVSLSAAAGLGRPLPAPDRARAGRLHAARHDHRRRGRRMLRQDRQAAGPGLSRRAGGRAGGARAAIRSASRCRGRCGASPAATSPSPASRRRCARPSRSCRQDDAQAIADLCASFQRTVGDVLVDRCANALALGAERHAGRGGRRRGQHSICAAGSKVPRRSAWSRRRSSSAPTTAP